MTALKRIESLRAEKTPNEIERALLSEELGEVEIGLGGYQYIENIAVSYLIVEVHNPGFIDWIENHPQEYVVHHKDGNILNNVYINLQVMSRSDHTSMHRTDPKYTKIEKARNEKISALRTDPKNAESEKVRDKAISKSLIAYNTDPANAETIRVRCKERSKTVRKSWIDLKTFKKFFTIGEYSEASNIHHDAAYYRLTTLFSEGQITCEKKRINGYLKNIYRRIEV